MIRGLDGLVCLCLVGCGAHSSVAQPARAAAKAAPPATHAAVAPLAFHDERSADRVFLENAERAIAQYRQFLARAGDDPAFAAAVQRSHDQVQDLQDEIEFVRAGMRERVAH